MHLGRLESVPVHALKLGLPLRSDLFGVCTQIDPHHRVIRGGNFNLSQFLKKCLQIYVSVFFISDIIVQVGTVVEVFIVRLEQSFEQVQLVARAAVPVSFNQNLAVFLTNFALSGSILLHFILDEAAVVDDVVLAVIQIMLHL